jgi:lipoprotein-releasing system permease protein
VFQIFLALRYLRSRRVNLISIGGVAAGVAVLIVVTSVMDGFRVKVLQVLRGNLSDITMTPTGDVLPAYEEMDRLIHRADSRVVATAPQIVVPVFYLYATRRRDQVLANGQGVLPLTAVGIDWEKERRVSDLPSFLVAANDPDRPFYSQRALDWDKAGTVVVSRTFAENWLGLRSLPAPGNLLETDVTLTFFDVLDRGGSDGGGTPAGNGVVRVRPSDIALPISAIYDAQDTSIDATQVYMDISTLRRLSGVRDAYHQIRVRLRDGEDAEAVKAEFATRFPDFVSETWKDQRAQFLRAVNNEKVLLVIVLSFIVLLGGFVILATLTLTVVEKTRDIGILAALGGSRGGIRNIFMVNGLLIGLIGAVLGVGLGALFTFNVNGVKDFLDHDLGIKIFPPDIYLFREIPTVWDWATVGWIVAGSIAMAFLAGFLPAMRASHMDPIKALRHE